MAQLDVDRIMAAIKDLETRILSLNVHLLRNEEELSVLYALREILEENIAELKRDNVIALAQDYRKAREDLGRTRLRVSFLEMDRATYQRAFEGQSAMLEYLKKKHEDMLKRLENNVIQGNFGRKDGR